VVNLQQFFSVTVLLLDDILVLRLLVCFSVAVVVEWQPG